VWTIFSYFGAQTFPAHFVSDAAFKMYFKSENRRSKVISKRPGLVAEEEMLRHICTTRREPIHKVWKKIRLSGLFTSKFVEYMDARQEEEE
jgi:hypothetical protein